MNCPEAEDLLEAYGASAEAYGLAVDAMVKVKIAESAQDDCTAALKAMDLHFIKHRCQPN
jgi:hypothetical protein